MNSIKFTSYLIKLLAIIFHFVFSSPVQSDSKYLPGTQLHIPAESSHPTKTT